MVVESRMGEKTAALRARVASGVVSGADASPVRRPMAHTGPPVLRRAKAIHENSRVPGAVLLAAFTVTILLLYLCAYAGVTADGFELSRLRVMNRDADLQRDTLQAEISRLSLPKTVAERAAALQMEQGTTGSVILVSDGAGKTAPDSPTLKPIR